MIPFPFNESQFSFSFFSFSFFFFFFFFFFVADHLLLGQLCTNPKQDRRCAAIQLMISTDPSYDNMTIASTLKMQIRTVQRLRAQLNTSDDPLEVVERKPKAEDTTRKTRTKEFIEKVQAIIDGTPQRPIRQIARDLGVSHTTVNACVKEDLNCRSYRHQTSQILTEKTKYLSREHHQHDLPQSQPDRRHPPSIRRAPAGACRKGMLPVPDPYRGGD